MKPSTLIGSHAARLKRVGLLIAIAAVGAACAPDADPRLDAMTGKAAEGRDLYLRLDCKTCHTTNGSRGVGPSLLDVFGSTHELEDGTQVTVDEDYIRATLRKAKRAPRKGYYDQMPNYGRLTATQVDSLIEFVKALK